MILDTCALLWLAQGGGQLSAPTRKRIDDEPCDRLIIATAQQHRMPVVTGDPIFKQYGIAVIS